MRQSKLFTKTRKEAPKDEVSKNASLLVRGGFIYKEMAGVYDFLPLGLIVFEKIVNIIREEMNKIGGLELHLSALQNPEIWTKTGRWDDAVVDSWFKTKLKSGTELGLGFTHEEPLTALVKEHISSWRDLPVYLYQFQDKFRNEERAKSGLMRTREFIMKDLYSFSRDEAEHLAFYEEAAEAYQTIFTRVGLGDITHKTFASGGSFSKFSHEFQTVCETGEDTIFINKDSGISINKEVYNDEVKKDLGLSGNFEETKAVEVGNIFTLGTRFSDALDLKYKNESGEEISVFMGSYGIGPARIMGTIVEALSDDKGIIWPDSVSPFNAHLIEIKGKDEETTKRAENLYKQMQAISVTTLYDDRDARAGEKFADADLIGIPWQVIVSERGNTGKTVEVKHRKTGKAKVMSEEEFLTGKFTELAD